MRWPTVACYCSSNRGDFGSPNTVLTYIDIRKDTNSNSFGSGRSV